MDASMTAALTFQKLMLKDLVTLLGTTCGVLAIVVAADGKALRFACLLVFLGLGFDLMDGYVARRLNQSNSIGIQIDSLSDAIVFGVAPALIAYRDFSSYYTAHGIFPWLSALLVASVVYFVVCGVVRLAWFNVDESEGYTGLVTPMSASYVVVYYLLAYYSRFAGDVGGAWSRGLAAAAPFFLFAVGTLNVAHFLEYGSQVRKKSGPVKLTILTGAVAGFVVFLVALSSGTTAPGATLGLLAFFFAGITSHVALGAYTHFKRARPSDASGG